MLGLVHGTDRVVWMFHQLALDRFLGLLGMIGQTQAVLFAHVLLQLVHQHALGERLLRCAVLHAFLGHELGACVEQLFDVGAVGLLLDLLHGLVFVHAHERLFKLAQLLDIVVVVFHAVGRPLLGRHALLDPCAGLGLLVGLGLGLCLALQARRLCVCAAQLLVDPQLDVAVLHRATVLDGLVVVGDKVETGEFVLGQLRIELLLHAFYDTVFAGKDVCKGNAFEIVEGQGAEHRRCLAHRRDEDDFGRRALGEESWERRCIELAHGLGWEGVEHIVHHRLALALAEIVARHAALGRGEQLDRGKALDLVLGT